MHMIHAILVKREMNPGESFQQAKEEARSIAMSQTEEYGDGRVFDWRTDEDAGRWAEQFPGIAVVLGAEEPERFMELLKHYSESPLRAALERLQNASYTDTGWRSPEEMANEGYVEIELPAIAESFPFETPEGKKYCGKPTPPIVITPEYLKSVWDGSVNWLIPYSVRTALMMVVGEYHSESHFYSAPDCEAKMSKETRERVKESPGEYALVFSDYHN